MQMQFQIVYLFKYFFRFSDQGLYDYENYTKAYLSFSIDLDRNFGYMLKFKICISE